MTRELINDRLRYFAARSDAHRHPSCALPWYDTRRYSQPAECEPEPSDFCYRERPEDRKRAGLFEGRGSWARGFITADPPRPNLEQPDDRDPWSYWLIWGLLCKSETAMTNKSLSDVAGKRVPSRIDRETIAMILDVCAHGKPGPGQRSIANMARILLSADDTAAELACWRARKQTQLVEAAQFFRRVHQIHTTKPEIRIPDGHELAEQLASLRPDQRIAA
jgi:hypothetical protein